MPAPLDPIIVYPTSGARVPRGSIALEWVQPLLKYKPGSTGYTLSRGGSAYQRLSDGSLDLKAAESTATLNSTKLRDTHYALNPVTGLYERSTLLEAQVTNLLQRSQQLGTSPWIASRATVTADATTAPDGTTTAEALMEDTQSNPHSVYQNLTMTSGTAYTTSVYVKGGLGRDYVRLDAYNGDGSRLGWIHVRLSTGAVTTTSGSVTAHTPVALANGWYRIAVTGTATVSGTGYFEVYPVSDTGTTNSYTGDVTKGLYLWGAQIEAGAGPTSYTPTTTSTAARATDVFYLAFGSAPQAMTLYGKHRIEVVDSNAQFLYYLSDSSGASPRLYLILTSSNLRFGFQGASGQFEAQVAGTYASGNLLEWACRLNADGTTRLDVSVNGGTVSTGTQNTGQSLPSVWGSGALSDQRLYVGGGPAGFNGSNAWLALYAMMNAVTIPNSRIAVAAA